MMSLKHLLAFSPLLGAAVVLAGCGDGGSTSRSTAGPTPTALQSTPTPTSSPDTQNALILHAFETSVVAFDVAVREMNPDDPAIPASTTGDQVVHELTTLNSWKAQGITAKGDLPRVIDSKLLSSSAATATVRACVYDPGVLIYKATGATVPTNVTGQFYVDVDATLDLVGGVWKVSHTTTQSEVDACLPGY
jgi:hypothetical protein